MSLITIIDVETTGTDPAKDQVIEVAAILYSLDHAAPVMSIATVQYCLENPCKDINGISTELSKICFKHQESLTWDIVRGMVGESIAMVAHNASFDASFVNHEPNRPGYLSPEERKPWVCTMKHVNWPVACQSKALVQIALAHGVGVVSAHRALSDCDTIARLLTRVHEMGHDLNELMRLAMRPRVIIQALVDYHDRQKAKDAQFEWDGDAKTWTKEVVKEDWQKTGYGFSTKVIGDAP